MIVLLVAIYLITFHALTLVTMTNMQPIKLYEKRLKKKLNDGIYRGYV